MPGGEWMYLAGSSPLPPAEAAVYRGTSNPHIHGASKEAQQPLVKGVSADTGSPGSWEVRGPIQLPLQCTYMFIGGQVQTALETTPNLRVAGRPAAPGSCQGLSLPPHYLATVASFCF
jgi:hypothetical protein